MKQALAASAAFLLCMAMQPAAAWSTYTVSHANFDVPPGDKGLGISALALNAAQRSLTHVSGMHGGSYQVCVQSHCTMLSSPDVGNNFTAYGLSNLGEPAGSATSDRERAYVGTRMIGYDRGNCGGCGLSLESAAMAVNSFGHATGWAEFNGVGGRQAFKYTPAAGIVNLGAPGESSEGLAINEWGEVVGTYSAGGVTRAFRHDASGTTDLGSLGGNGAATWAHAINDSRRVVGCSVNSSGVRQAFRYSAGAMLALPALASAKPSCALAINNSNVAVGYSTTASGQSRAVVYEGSGIKNLNALLDPNDPHSADWVLTSATAINDSGVIVGDGKYKGASRAFVLTPR